jgi:hypothetical protein
MLYVILLNTCCVDQLLFTVQHELSKLQINHVKIFIFLCKMQDPFANVFCTLPPVLAVYRLENCFRASLAAKKTHMSLGRNPTRIFFLDFSIYMFGSPSYDVISSRGTLFWPETILASGGQTILPTRL